MLRNKSFVTRALLAAICAAILQFSNVAWAVEPETETAPVVDVAAVASNTRKAELHVTSPSDGGAEVDSIHIGQSVTLEPVGYSTQDSVKFNYVWSYNGGWDYWYSTLQETKDYTQDKTFTFTPSRSGKYVLYVDVIQNGKTTTLTKEINVTEWWSFNNLNVSSEQLHIGQSVTVTPVVSGEDAAAARFNYVWNYKGEWSHWGSTVKDKGGYTKDASWTFTPDRAGRYELYVDAVRSDGSATTKKIEVNVQSNWKASSLSVKANSADVGGTAYFGTALNVSFAFQQGSNLTGLAYNFGWRYGNNWNEWDSLAKNGKTSSANSYTFSPKKTGTYHLFADVIGTDGTKQTIERAITVKLPYTVKGLSLSSQKIGVGESITVAPKLEGDHSKATFNYVWAYEGKWDDWSSTINDSKDHKPTSDSSWVFTPKKYGRYVIYVDVNGPDGSSAHLQGDVTVEKGWSDSGLSLDKTSPQYVNTPISLSTNLSGKNADQVEFNWVWQRDNWADWSSTIKDTNKYTGDAVFKFEPKHSGNYEFYLDVRDKRTGQVVTYSAKMRVNKRWSLKGLKLSYSSPLRPNARVDMKPEVSGDTTGLRYNFVWQANNWSKWDSTRKQYGDYSTIPSNYTYTSVSGTYSFYVDVIDKNGEVESAQVTGIRAMYAAEIINRVEATMSAESPFNDGYKYERALTNAGGTLCNNRHGWWCATFIWWSFHQNGFDDLWGRNHLQVDPEWLANDFRSMGRYTSGTAGLRRGDILFFYWVPWRPNQGITHAAYVTSVNGSSVTVAEGNMGSRTVHNTYPIWSSAIRGYARPNY